MREVRTITQLKSKLRNYFDSDWDKDLEEALSDHVDNEQEQVTAATKSGRQVRKPTHDGKLGLTRTKYLNKKRGQHRAF